jgi:type IV pilus assembly protein PilN
MIRINLIATTKKHANNSGGMLELVVLLLLVMLGAGGVFFWYSSMEERINRDNVKVTQEKVTIKHLAKATKVLKQFKNKEKELKRQLKIINKLKKSKQGPVRVLDQINVRIPKQVWLTNVSQKGGQRLLLRGIAENNESVAIFLKRLEDSPYFKTDLQQIVRQRYNTGNSQKQKSMRTSFSVSCKVRFYVQDT